MAKKKHTHERHPGGRGRHNPKTPKGERELHYGQSDRAQRAARAELREIGGHGGFVGAAGFYGAGGMLSGVQFEGSPGEEAGESPAAEAAEGGGGAAAGAT